MKIQNLILGKTQICFLSSNGKRLGCLIVCYSHSICDQILQEMVKNAHIAIPDMRMEIISELGESVHLHLQFPKEIDEKDIDVLMSAIAEEFESLQMIDITLPFSHLSVEN